MWFPVLVGPNCSFEEILSVSGAGTFTFTYDQGFLYVCDEGTSGASVIKIYDMSDPFGPVLVSTTGPLAAQTYARNPRIYGDELYIPYQGTPGGGSVAYRALAIWDVSDRTSPALLGQLNITYTNSPGGTNGPRSVAKIGDFACVALGPAFGAVAAAAKVDVSDPTNPVVVDTFNWDAVAHANHWVQEFGNTFFVSGQRGSGGTGFVVSVDATTFNGVDIITTANPFEFHAQTKITADGSRMYAPIGNGADIATYNVSNPANITQTSRVAMTQTGTATQGSPLVIVELTNRLYIGRPNGGGLLIPIMDITDRDTPVVNGSLSTSGETVSDMCNITEGCAGFAWGQGTGAAIHLLGTAPLS